MNRHHLLVSKIWAVLTVLAPNVATTLLSWSDTENFYSNDRSILTLSPMEATHC